MHAFEGANAGVVVGAHTLPASQVDCVAAMPIPHRRTAFDHEAGGIWVAAMTAQEPPDATGWVTAIRSEVQ